jgi:hypothetical protein
MEARSTAAISGAELPQWVEEIESFWEDVLEL